MLSQHREVFFTVAAEKNCWIGLREPNPLSEKWFGRPGCVPKDMQCKAKTADNPNFEYSGLVANPETRPEAFTSATLESAKKTWSKFLVAGQLPLGWTCVVDSVERGLVKNPQGSFLFADYDLMAICRANAMGEMLFTSNDEATKLSSAARGRLNELFKRIVGVEMIQHGSEFEWAGGVGARESELVYWFGPGRRFHVGTSSMPKSPDFH